MLGFNFKLSKCVLLTNVQILQTVAILNLVLKDLMLTRVSITVIIGTTYLNKSIALLKKISSTHIVFVQIILRVSTPYGQGSQNSGFIQVLAPPIKVAFSNHYRGTEVQCSSAVYLIDRKDLSPSPPSPICNVWTNPNGHLDSVHLPQANQ